MLLHSFMRAEEELMEDLCATKSEIRKLKTLALYFHHLQLKGEASLGFSYLTKEDYEEFKSHSRHWIHMDPRFGKELEHYLNSPVPETLKKPFQTRLLRQKIVIHFRQPLRGLNQMTT